ncbi:hypothetical protein [Clostridium sp. D33t1_170424_F3]|uniref:hypothetical protein n=1 Tax=Clostridium sp. D33t1_170424_F3 TaxID=2787099 RepID=UPI0018AB0653|nr:hypothetical protein [Clostridium sp. D33t1_170424_F3]
MWKKALAPVIITIFLVLWFGVWLTACVLLPIVLWGKLLGSLLFASLIGVSVYVLVQRIKEIRSGEEDDLGKY